MDGVVPPSPDAPSKPAVITGMTVEYTKQMSRDLLIANLAFCGNYLFEIKGPDREAIAAVLRSALALVESTTYEEQTKKRKSASEADYSMAERT